ncbi:uncharacterized protein LOC113209720 isoform X1 [Frankliniella occidentalis]|uniref:Uncharacterized protein LOC113209720 isoform X1 n=1 Tax=Frankliniella occidentalis TaxID=133901 RepID=A0A6J1SV14_FRAOC|nr:uncharacterized protein LOC113209720 isoform X1 [Frankliniella occidentalis]
MSRSAEEQQILDQRIQAMKQKNEELRRRHLEVEADKQSAAKQNALVKMNVPLDDDWVPGRHDDNPRHDRQQNEGPSPPHERGDDNGQRYEQRRHRNDGQRDERYSHNQRHFQNSNMRRSDQQGSRQRPDDDRFYGNENRRSGEYGGRSNDGSSSRSKEWVQHGHRGEGGQQSSFPSKVFKNSSIESDRSKRPAYRLAEGDGPPPDPSYSFLGDSMRDSRETGERRGQPNRRGFQRGRGRGGQTWNNRNYNDFRKDGFDDRKDGPPTNFDGNRRQSDDAWRRERSLIDQERINRQKTSDGNWSREWDNHKVLQDGDDRPNRWRRGNQTQNYDRGQPRRGFQEEYGNGPKQSYSPRNNTHGNITGHDSAGKDEHDESSRNKFIRRGRFSNQTRYKDNTRHDNGSGEKPSSNITVETPKEAEDAVLIESHVKSVEKLQVSVVVDPMGSQKRCVEEVGGNLLLTMSQDAAIPDFSKNNELKRSRKSPRKARRNRVLSTTSTGTTTGTAEEDGSWEDLSSDEGNVSILTDLQRAPDHDLGLSKSIDVSSGPESLDPIPAPGKEDEFLWDDFHPAGFQDNATLDLDAEAAYQALLNEQAKQEVNEDGSSHSHKVSFRLDTSCLEDSGDELDGAKLDPLLVTTQIVQAEVDCMSLTSIPTDTSLPEDLSQLVRSKGVKDEKITEEDTSNVAGSGIHEKTVSAEELSGPVSILDIPPSCVQELEQDGPRDTPIKREDGELSNIESSSHIMKEEAENANIQLIKETECAPKLELGTPISQKTNDIICLKEEENDDKCNKLSADLSQNDQTNKTDGNGKVEDIKTNASSLISHESDPKSKVLTPTAKESIVEDEVVDEKGNGSNISSPQTQENESEIKKLSPTVRESSADHEVIGEEGNKINVSSLKTQKSESMDKELMQKVEDADQTIACASSEKTIETESTGPEKCTESVPENIESLNENKEIM